MSYKCLVETLLQLGLAVEGVCGSSPHRWGISQKLIKVWESMTSPSSILQNQSLHATK